jgi:hypothetical protein
MSGLLNLILSLGALLISGLICFFFSYFEYSQRRNLGGNL